MQCVKCGSPLKIVSGGLKTEVGSTIIKMVHVFGCMNPDCNLKMQEQARQENEQESFEG